MWEKCYHTLNRSKAIILCFTLVKRSFQPEHDNIGIFRLTFFSCLKILLKNASKLLDTAGLSSERCLEEHELVVQVQASMNSDSRFLFRKNYAKYEFFRNPLVIALLFFSLFQNHVTWQLVMFFFLSFTYTHFHVCKLHLQHACVSVFGSFLVLSVTERLFIPLIWWNIVTGDRTNEICMTFLYLSHFPTL